MLKGHLRTDGHFIELEGYSAGSFLTLYMSSPTMSGESFLDKGFLGVDGEEMPATWAGDSLYLTIGANQISVFQGVEFYDGVKLKSRLNEEFFVEFGSVIREVLNLAENNPTTNINYVGDLIGAGGFSKITEHKIKTKVGDIEAEVKLSMGTPLFLEIKGVDDYELILEEDGEVRNMGVYPAKSELKKFALLKNLFPEYRRPMYEAAWSGQTSYTFDEIVEMHPEKNYSWLKEQNYFVINEMNKAEEILKEFWKHDGLIGFDTETTGLKFNCDESDLLVGLILCKEEGTAYYFPFRHKKFKNLCEESKIGWVIENYFKPILETKDLATQNGGFDWKVMYSMGVCCNIVEDTLILIKTTLWNDHRHMQLGLKPMTHQLLGLDTLELSDFVEGKFGDGFKFWDMGYDETSLYACPDADMVLRLIRFAKENKILESYNAFSTYQCEVRFMIVIAYQEYYGHCVDVDRLEELVQRIRETKERTMREMIEIVGHEFNPNSSPQLAKIFFQEQGYPIVEKTETGNPSTGKGTRKKLMSYKNADGSDMYPLARMLNEYSEVSQLESNFTNNVEKFSSRSGYMFSQVQQFLETGRVSVKEPNYQSYNDTVKKYIVPRTGFYAMDADYSSVEYRILAGMANQENLVKWFFNPDGDYHRYQAARMFNIPYEAVTSKQRKNAKGINFGLPYGMGDKSLAETIFGVGDALHVAKAIKLKRKYFEGQEKIEEFFNKARADGVRDGFSSTYFGRRRYFDKTKTSVSKIRREAGNNRIQGTAADIYKRAMVRLFDYLVANDMLGKVLLSAFVHDEIFLEVHKSIDPAKMLGILSKAMKLEIEGWCPLYIGCGYGRNWYEAKNTEIPIQVQDIILDRYEESGIEWWNGDTDRLMSWEIALINEYRRDRILGFIRNKENWGKVIPPEIDSVARDLLGAVKSGETDVDVIDSNDIKTDLSLTETMFEVGRVFGCSEDVERAGFVESTTPVVEAQEEVEEEQEPVDTKRVAIDRVKNFGVGTLSREEGMSLIFRLEDDVVFMQSVKSTLKNSSGNNPVLCLKDGKLFDTGLTCNLGACYSQLLRMYMVGGN